MSENSFKIRVAVVSDLHCHDLIGAETGNVSENLKWKLERHSWLTVSEKRVPINQHPVESLRELAERNDLKCDIVLCPGDLGHMVCDKGIVYGWERVAEVREILQAQKALGTIGNHDVTSRESGSDPFRLAKSISPAFPTTNKLGRQSFWSDGYYIDVTNKNCAILVLNTASEHFNADTAQAGTFNDGCIEDLSRLLNGLESWNNALLKIAMLHHHPILHSTKNYDSGDVLPTGDELMKVLGENGVKVVVHGHRHEPRVRRVNTISGHDILVMASGSFSALLNDLSTRSRNLFHIIELEVTRKGPLILTGELLSWEYNHGSGWNPSTERSAELPHYVRFSIPVSSLDLSKVAKSVDSQPGAYLRSDLVRDLFPEFFQLLPQELEQAKSDLYQHHHIRLRVNEDGTIDAAKC